MRKSMTKRGRKDSVNTMCYDKLLYAIHNMYVVLLTIGNFLLHHVTKTAKEQKGWSIQMAEEASNQISVYLNKVC